MKTDTPKTIFLKDYQKPNYLIKTTELTFQIFDEKTRVSSKLTMERNYEANEARPLEFSGDDLTLVNVSIDGKIQGEADYTVTSESLVLQPTETTFTVEIVVEIDPSTNTALEGLYQSGDIFCTQNEPEGFRKITYFLDRSDVMSIYTTRIEADKARFPFLLSNGNRTDAGDLDNGRHFTVWNDPFPKPSYLFALVAGDLALISDSYTTCSGREVTLEMYVDKGNEDRVPFALNALKDSMKWDEDRFGLEYDLDIYMIVAVDAFNMGAMENKGLNIFNTSCALANNKTATDSNFFNIESIIGHEYFHNWTGNRVTCRDWFQLTLKEGLTVFRDQEFSADLNSRPVCRIADVTGLRNSQFVEDAGPSSHPIQPASYMEINNFYTPTVYQKGAAVIRMIHTFVGEEKFQLGMKKYFELYDGQAVTTQDFIKSMEIASGADLGQFQLWYSQAGTPRLEVSTEYNSEAQTYSISIAQSCPSTPGAAEKKPFHMPFIVGLLDQDGKEMNLQLQGESEVTNCATLHLREAEQTFTFANIASEPVPSLMRDFSAPVIMSYDYSKGELAFLLANDNDAFNRFEAGQRLALGEIARLTSELQVGSSPDACSEVVAAFKSLFNNSELDNAFKAQAMSLPSLTTILEGMEEFSVEEAGQARDILRQAISTACESELLASYKELHHDEAYEYNAVQSANRTLKNYSLACLVLLEKEEYLQLALQQFNNADNMTDEIAAFSALAQIDCKEAKEATAAFYAKWKDDVLVMNKYFSVEASSKLPGLVEKLLTLQEDPAFDKKNPNKVRSLFGVFCGNLRQYHAADGSGYQLIGDKIIEITKFNPQLAAGLAKQFKKYAYVDAGRKAFMKTQLERILAENDLSRDVFEVVTKTLKQG